MNAKLPVLVFALAACATLPASPAHADDAAPAPRAGTTRLEIVARGDRGATQRIDLTLATPDVGHRSEANLRDASQRGYRVSLTTRMSSDDVLMAEVDIELYDETRAIVSAELTGEVQKGKRILLGRLPDAGDRGLQVMMTMR